MLIKPKKIQLKSILHGRCRLFPWARLLQTSSDAYIVGRVNAPGTTTFASCCIVICCYLTVSISLLIAEQNNLKNIDNNSSLVVPIVPADCFAHTSGFVS